MLAASHPPCPPLAWLARDVSQIMFSTLVRIKVEAGMVSFVNKATVVNLSPVVCIDLSDHRRIVSVGEVPSSSKTHIVRLFDGITGEIDKENVLEAFFRYGLRKVITNPFLRAPKVSLQVSPEIVAQLGGYHGLVLRHSLLNAGVVEVAFDNTHELE